MNLHDLPPLAQALTFPTAVAAAIALEYAIRAIETRVERRQRLRLGRVVRSERGGLR